jgi:hypothetical protein
MIATNPNFSGSSQATNSPNVSLPYLWDGSLNGGEGAWRPTATGDFMTATIENAQISVDLNYTEDSVNVWTSDGQTLSSTGNLQVGNAVVSAGNPVPVNGTLITTATDLDIRALTYTRDAVTARQADHDLLNANVNLQVVNSDVLKSNPVPTVGVLVADSYITATTTALNESLGVTGAQQTMWDGSYQLSSHGYLVQITPQGNEYRGVFEIEASSDGGTTWVLLEQQILSGTASAATGVAYFDNWNFPKARASITNINGRVAANCPKVTGGFTIIETHTP